jgi:PAS domain S-box-containing protein
MGDHEAAVLETETETQLTHGSGLGLWLSNWIITSQDGSIDATSSDEGTTMTISVPRKPASNVQKQLTELTRARDQYQAAFEEANDAMVIIDDEARIIDANPEASAIYGLDSQALLGQPFQRFLPEDFDFEAAWDTFQNARRERDTVTIVGADGVERQVEYSAATDIIPGQHLVVSRDVTERVQQEQDLKQIETLFQHAHDALLLSDANRQTEGSSFARN